MPKKAYHFTQVLLFHLAHWTLKWIVIFWWPWKSLFAPILNKGAIRHSPYGLKNARVFMSVHAAKLSHWVLLWIFDLHIQYASFQAFQLNVASNNVNVLQSPCFEQVISIPETWNLIEVCHSIHLASSLCQVTGLGLRWGTFWVIRKLKSDKINYYR